MQDATFNKSTLEFSQKWLNMPKLTFKDATFTTPKTARNFEKKVVSY